MVPGGLSFLQVKPPILVWRKTDLKIAECYPNRFHKLRIIIMDLAQFRKRKNIKALKWRQQNRKDLDGVCS